MSFDFEKEEPKVFVEGQMRTVFNLLEDMKLELRGYDEAELQEVKEFAKRWLTVPNRVMVVIASHMFDQCNYQMTMLRAADKALKKSEPTND